MFIGIESLRDSVLEFHQKGLLVPSMLDVVRHILRLLQVLHDDVVVAEGGGGDGFFVSVFTVDYAGLAWGWVGCGLE